MVVDQPSHTLDHGVTAPVRVLRKALRVTQHIVFHPWRTVKATRAIASTKQPSTLRFLKLLLNWLYVSTLTRGLRRIEGVHLFDQAILQGVWSIALSGDETAVANLARDLREQILSPDLVAIVEVSIPEIERRLRLRPGFSSRVDQRRLVDPGILARCARRLELIKNTLSALTPEKGSVRCITIVNETTDDLELQAQGLADTLEEMVRSRGGGPYSRETR